MSEIARSENLEAEKTPEQAVTNAVASIENKDAAENTVPQKILESAKLDFKAIVQDSKTLASFASTLALKISFGVLKFAFEVLKKKGKISFKEGYEIGKEMFDFEKGKDKK